MCAINNRTVTKALTLATFCAAANAYADKTETKRGTMARFATILVCLLAYLFIYLAMVSHRIAYPIIANLVEFKRPCNYHPAKLKNAFHTNQFSSKSQSNNKNHLRIDNEYRLIAAWCDVSKLGKQTVWLFELVGSCGRWKCASDITAACVLDKNTYDIFIVYQTHIGVNRGFFACLFNSSPLNPKCLFSNIHHTELVPNSYTSIVCTIIIRCNWYATT